MVQGLSTASVPEYRRNGLAWRLCIRLRTDLQCSYVSTLKRCRDMGITKLSGREFNQDTSRAKRAAKRGPVFITDRGRLSHVLLTAEEYQRLTHEEENAADLLAMPEAAAVQFEPPRLMDNLHKLEDLS